ncbi:diguanylate cyclase [Aestuariirhabdus sp. Z084]|uniref:sensor domain-containing diguanylate cyclase n=1 Tax=Aestuariirhabdus haliotis TaxID=2918751 RepID=UPI00201B3D68|nr:diguanylate cyclase [Aestuariirhabdus haliotis]MCL6417725.1 diguanylate cyclase [Aestuariirhabdus haliotis]MCL6421670.1 diguanylate cyclase [Aestuariirhabdus haliotis]
MAFRRLLNRLSLRNRLLLAIALALVLLLPVSSYLAHLLIAPSFMALEKQRLQRDKASIESALQQRIEWIDGAALDWAHWNDTYDFVNGNNERFIPDNLDLDSVVNLDLNWVLIMDRTGKVLANITVDLNQQRLQPLPPQLMTLPDQKHLFLDGDKPRAFSGLYAIDGLLLSAAVEPITDSARRAAPNGLLLMARFMDASVLSDIQQVTGTRFRLLFSDQFAEFGDQKRHILDGGEWLHLAEDKQQGILGYRLKEVSGDPVLVRINRELTIMQQGDRTIRSYLLVMLGLALTVMVLLAVLIRIGLIDRLEWLQKSVRDVGKGVREKVIPFDGEDELSELSRDISWMVHRLSSENERQQLLMDQLVDGFVEFNLDGRIEVVNLALAKMLEYDRQSLESGHIRDVVAKEYLPFVQDYLRWIARHPEEVRRESIEFLTLSGNPIFVEVHASAMLSAHGVVTGVRGVVRDITDQHKAHIELSHLAYHDPLTGLYNREALTEELDTLLRTKKQRLTSLGLLYMDLDRFKKVNDTLGHQVGDLLLQEISERIKGCLRDDDFIARVGGDEFVVLLKNSDTRHYGAVASKLVARLNQPYTIEGAVVDYLGISIGISLCPEHSDSYQELLRLADQAMYQAKKNNTGYQLYTPGQEAVNVT